MLFKYSLNSSDSDIHANITREKLRNILNSGFFEFKKTPLCTNQADSFHNLRIHAFYNPVTDKLEGIELFHPNRIFYTHEICLLDEDVKSLMYSLKKNKIPFTKDPVGIDLEQGKIAVYAPYIETQYPECFSVYFDLSQGAGLKILESKKFN